MKKLSKVLLIVFLFIALAFIAAVTIAIYKPQAYENMINKILIKQTGYQYSTKDISIQITPTKIVIDGFELINPEWNSDPILLTVDNIQLSLDIRKLLNNTLPFWGAELQNFELHVKENEKQQLNWLPSVLADRPAPENEEPLNLKSLLSFSEISVKQGKVTQQKLDTIERIGISSLLLERVSDQSITLHGLGEYKEQAIDINGNIDIDGKDPIEQLLQFSVNAQGFDVDLHTAGQINPNNLDGAKVSVNAKSENLEKIEAFLETTFPALTPLDLSLELLSNKGDFEVSKINLNAGENKLIGDVSYRAKDSYVAVNLISEKLDLSSFVEETPNQENIAHEKQVEGTPDIQESEMDWTWVEAINTQVNLEIGELVFQEHSLKDFSTSLRLADKEFKINDLTARYLKYGEDDSKNSIESDEISIQGIVKPISTITTKEDLDVNINISDSHSTISLAGLANINGLDGNEVKLHVDSKNLYFLSEFLQIDLSPYVPLNVDVNVSTSLNTADVQQLKIQTKDSDLSGDVSLSWEGEILNIDGKVNSSLLDLSPIMVTKEGEGNEENKKTVDGEKSIVNEKLFSDEAINWDWLDLYNSKFDISVNKLIANENVLNKVKVKITTGDGSLAVQPLQALFADGSLNSVMSLKKDGENVIFNTKFDAINLSLAALGATSESVLEGGTTDVVMDFSGKGNSLHQLASSLNGEIVTEVQKGIIKNDAFEAIGADIVLELLTMLNPFMKEDETTELECAAVKFTAKDGVLTSNNQMAVETTKMKIVGGGVIDLSSEELEVGFSPSAKKGVGVNVGSLVKFVRLGGTLKNPHPEADPVGILKSGAAIGAAVSTGGLSLLVEGLFKRATTSGSACNQALSDVIEQDSSNLEENKLNEKEELTP